MASKSLKPLVSVIVIFDQVRESKLCRLLESMKNQLDTYNFGVEILFIQESNSSASLPPMLVKVKHFTIPKKQGIPFNRNKGIEFAKGEFIVFIDDDCWVQEQWLQALVAPLLQDQTIHAVTSGTKIPPSNFVGNCISALGFPGGGSLGFTKVWKVNQDGFTDHLAAGNCALRRSLFDKVGRFDEDMKYGAEDAEFSHRLTKEGIKIKYVPEGYAFHEARSDLQSFIRWQLRRGKANYHFKKKVGKVGSFIKLRLWSAKNIMSNNLNYRLPFIFFFLGSSFCLQQLGYIMEKRAVLKKK